MKILELSNGEWINVDALSRVRLLPEELRGTADMGTVYSFVGSDYEYHAPTKDYDDIIRATDYASTNWYVKILRDIYELLRARLH